MGTQWIRSNDVVCEELDGNLLLVSPRSGARWLLNATAAAIWNLCDGTRSLAGAEIAAFCGAFENLGLLHVAAGAQPQLIPCTMNFEAAPNFRQLNAGSGGRRRPSPRGVSGPV